MAELRTPKRYDDVSMETDTAKPEGNATETPSASALRLRKHADYQRAYAAAARKQHSHEMSFFFARRDRIPTRALHPNEAPLAKGPRIGLTVPKALGKAHDRNRIKRRMRAAVALHAAELGGLPVDVILHPRRTVLDLDWDKLQREVREVFRTVRRSYDAPPAPASADRSRGKRKPAKAVAHSTKPAAHPTQPGPASPPVKAAV